MARTWREELFFAASLTANVNYKQLYNYIKFSVLGWGAYMYTRHQFILNSIIYINAVYVYYILYAHCINDVYSQNMYIFFVLTSSELNDTWNFESTEITFLRLSDSSNIWSYIYCIRGPSFIFINIHIIFFCRFEHSAAQYSMKKTDTYR